MTKEFDNIKILFEDFDTSRYAGMMAIEHKLGLLVQVALVAELAELNENVKQLTFTLLTRPV